MSEGEVLEKTTTMMGSDHDAVALHLSCRPEASRLQRTSRTAPRHLKAGSHAHLLHLRTEMTCEWIQHIRGEITQVKRNKAGFVESNELKSLRQQAHRTPDPKEATTLWKQVWKNRRAEKKQYHDNLASRAIQKDWAALREIRSRPARQWQSSGNKTRLRTLRGSLQGTTTGKGRNNWRNYVNDFPICAKQRRSASSPQRKLL